MNTQEQITAFLRDLENRNYAKGTVWIASAALLFFVEYLRAERRKDDLRQVEQADIEAFAQVVDIRKSAKRKDKNWSVFHKNRTLSTVKQFFAFLTINEKIMTDVAREVVLWPEGDCLPRNILTEEEARHLFSVLPRDTPVRRRDYTALKTLYHTGLRKSELETLTLKDIDLEGRILHVQGKFAKQRVVPLGEAIARELQDYLKHTRPILTRRNPMQELIFVTDEGGKMAVNQLVNIVKARVKDAGIGKSITTHCLRHTFATHLLRRGASVRHIQQILGHEDLSTTEIYTRVAIRDLQEHYDRTHPRALADGLLADPDGKRLKLTPD